MEGIGAGHVQRHRIGVLGQVGDIPPSSPGLHPTPHICYEPGVPLLTLWPEQNAMVFPQIALA